MKVLVLSDTHGDLYYAERVLKKHEDIKMVIHLGDYFRDAQKLAEMFPDKQFEYVYGNSDFMIEDVPSEKLIECCGKKFFITHGHRYSVKWDYEKLFKKAESEGVDVLLFGHTHVSDIVYRQGYIVANPGSISDARGGQDESYAIIEIDGDKITVEIKYAR